MRNCRGALAVVRSFGCVTLSTFVVVGNAYAASVTLDATGGDGKIALSWNVSGDLGNVQVMRDTDSNPAGRVRVAILGGNARGYTDTSVVNGRQYWYWIKYTDAAGAVGNSNAGSATPAASDNSNDNAGVTCANAVPVSLPKVFTGEADTCVVTSGTIDNVNSWNVDTVEINGVSYKDKWSNQMPARINGNYYIRYVAKQSWAHFEINGSGGNNDNSGDNPVANYTLDVGISGNGSTSISTGSHSYKSGTAVTITATPSSGSVFSGWSGAFTGNANPLTITMNGNKSLTANFAPKSIDNGTPPDPVGTTAAPFGFGRSVTGGVGGAKVRVTTPDQLRNALCGSTSGGNCSDDTPRIIEVASTIDFTDTEGSAQGQGCYATKICSAPAKSEATLKYRAGDTHCDGKTMFDITYKKAATRGLLVGSNKTLVGVGRAGAIKGKGLLLMGGVSNIIIRNLSFTDIAQGLVFGGDGITVSDATRVWIDHNYFARIGRQMIVTGTGDQTGVVTDMTVSWNEFDGRNEYAPFCDGKHYWNHLFYGKGNFTFANNWLHDFSGRAPKIDSTAIAHVVNNFFENGSGHALDTGKSVHALVEGNDFENVAKPITDASSHVYGLSASSSSSDGACRAALGRSCVPNEVSSSFAKQDNGVLDAIGGVSHDAIITPATANGVSATVRSGAGVGKI